MVGALKAASYKENLPSPLASDPNLPNLKFSAVSLSVYREAQNSLLEMRPRVLGLAKPQQTRAELSYRTQKFPWLSKKEKQIAFNMRGGSGQTYSSILQQKTMKR